MFYVHNQWYDISCATLYIAICGLSCCIMFFSTFLINYTIFEKKKISDIRRVFIFSTNLSEKFLALRRIQRDMIVRLCRSSWEIPVFLVQILIKFEFSRKMLKNPSNIKLY